jgi:hypothetical protein
MTPLDIALSYIARGWNVTPVEYRGKRPLGNGWQLRIIDASNAPHYFNGEQLNIGAVLGPSSHKLTDVDEDADEAICIGPYILPRTQARFGRASKRDSHRLYYSNLSDIDRPAAIAFDDPRKPKQQGRLIELRIGGSSGAQSVLPGSIHKSGEAVTWEEDGTPSTVDGDDLLQRVRTVAAYGLLARYWPAEGSGHHDTARVVGGFLARIGLDPKTVRSHVEAIARATKSPRWRELCRTAEDAAKALAAGKHAFGLGGLREAFGADIAEKVCEWLNYQGPQENNADDATTNPTAAPPHSWDDPDISILDDCRGELPAFPLDVFSNEMQALIERNARGAGVTHAHVAVPLIGIVSGLIGMSCRVKVSSSWHSPLTCWTILVGISGTGKTPGINVTRRALKLIERLGQPEENKRRRDHETRKAAAKAVCDKWKEAVEDAIHNNKTPPDMPQAAVDPGKYIAARMFVADSTIERLAELLRARSQGLILVRDELAALFMNMSRYSGGQDNEFWLEAWNGDHFNVERKNSGSLSIDHLLIGMVGGMQPDKLVASFKGDQDGQYARVLFAWPEEPQWGGINNDAAEVDDKILKILLRADDLAEFEDDQLEPYSLPLDKAAAETFAAFAHFAHQERKVLEGRERDWAAKMTAHVLRLAGTLTYMEWGLTTNPRPVSINVRTMQAAITLVRDYFWPHARACLRQIGLTERHANARRVLRWIKGAHKQEVSREEVRREGLGKTLDADQTQAVINSLCDAGWLRPVTTMTPGRARHRWGVNPCLFGC